MALAFGPSPRHRVPMSHALAPRDALLEEYNRVAESSPLINAESAARSKYIAELLADGDLEEKELIDMFEEVAGKNDGLDADGFVELCNMIDELFEEYDEEDIDEEDKQAKSTESINAPTLAAEILDMLEEKEPIRRDYDGYDEVITKVESLVEAAPLDATSFKEEKVVGDWHLAYASSSSFAFNDGYSGVGKTTPGGAAFVSLLQRFDYRKSGAKAITVIETFATTVGGADLVVTVNGDWSVVQRTEPITRRPLTLLEVKPRNVKYGLVVVDGNRVEKGWKTMRILNSLELVYLDSKLRIQRGSGGAYFLWRKEDD